MRQTRNNLFDMKDKAMKLERIKKHGSKTKPPKNRQLDSDRRVGTTFNSTCFACRNYLDSNIKTVHEQIAWYCSI